MKTTIAQTLKLTLFAGALFISAIGQARPNCKNGMPANECSLWSTTCVKTVMYDQGGFAHSTWAVTRVCNDNDCNPKRQYKTSPLCTFGGAVVVGPGGQPIPNPGQQPIPQNHGQNDFSDQLSDEFFAE